MTYHVTCSTDDNYLQHCMAMLCSLFENNMEHKFCVHMLVSRLSKEGRTLISELGARYHHQTAFYDIDDAMVRGMKMNTRARFNGKQMYSIATYYRIFLPSLLPEEIDRILYLDCDIIVLSDVQELFELNLNEYGVAAVKDATPVDDVHRNKMGLGLQHSAFCAGVMMINLQYWKETNAQAALIEYSTRDWKKVYMQDQDALNYVFRDKWLMLPYKWGRTTLSVAPIDKKQRGFDINEYVFSPGLIHYSSHEKPWLDVWFPDRSYYWKYLKLSGFPNPITTPLKRTLKLKIYLKIIRFYLNKYVRPLIPDIVEILLRDIFNLVNLIVSAIQGPRSFKQFLLKRWKGKYYLV